MKYRLIFIGFLLVFSCNSIKKDSADFLSDWSQSPELERNWAGKDYWLNPLQSWKQEKGKMNCMVSGGDRNIVLLTRALSDENKDFSISFSFQKLSLDSVTENLIEGNDQSETEGKMNPGLSGEGWVGIQLGLQGQFNDFRDDAIKGKGFCVGAFKDGTLFIGNPEEEVSGSQIIQNGGIHISGKSLENEMVELTVELDTEGKLNNVLTKKIHSSWLEGLTALTCSQSLPDKKLVLEKEKPPYDSLSMLNRSVGGNTNYAFWKWTAKGERIIKNEKNAYGPIMWAQHTLSDDVLKMSVQLPPVGNDSRVVELQVAGKKYNQEIDDLGRNAIFRIENWNSTKDHEYTLEYKMNSGETDQFEGVIKADPKSQTIKLASLSCVDDRGFPHQDVVDNVIAHKPDLVSFHGDQLYERVAGYGVERNSILDYQRKWYIFGWSFRDLLRNTPAIIIPDDHDVFHGNLWGQGGKAANVNLGYGYDAQDDGGYKEPPEFVNMVHRTQTGHLPDPYDPTPVEQEISVYYTNLNYGGISLAILGDRQWKTAPKAFLPNALIENGWPQNKKWNPKTEAFHPDAELLGPRQEDFLEDWVGDWKYGTSFKAVISQSPFCNVATLPADIWHDKFVPSLPKYREGEYPPDDRPVADFDSNGWPQNKRDKAVNTIKKAFALHITGDQHLGSTGQYGTEEYGDGPYWISSPAVANLWPRRWFPAEPAKSGKSINDNRKYSGDYEDGFGNKITVHGIANPHNINREPSMVYDKAPGYSIIEFDKGSRDIKLEVWPRWSGPDNSIDNEPYKDWPITIKQTDNFNRKDKIFLDEIQVNGEQLVEVRLKSNGELLYNLIPPKGNFVPFVFDNQDYSVSIKEIKVD